MDFLQDIYVYSFEGIIDNVYQYRFISTKVENEVTKIVSLSPLSADGKWYNLAFGNLEIDKTTGEPFVNDESENNNNDFDKVLATVFTCLLNFLNARPDAKIVFFGNTEHKQLMYKRKISAHISSLQEYFIVQGGFADYDVEWKIIEKEVQKKSRSVKRTVRVKDHNSLNFRNITSLEIYNPHKSRDYHFVLIALNDVLNINI
jgi:hypothetical protein